VVCGWVVFRCDDLIQAADYFTAMFRFSFQTLPAELVALFDLKNTLLLLCAATALILPAGNLKADDQLRKRRLLPATVGIIVFLVLLPWCASILVSGNLNPFIYYRF